MAIIDNLKNLFFGIWRKGRKSQEQKIDGVAIERCDSLHDKTSKEADQDVHIYVPQDMSLNLIDDDLVEEAMPCVYGPPSWYNEEGELDRRNPEVKEIISEIEEVEKRNRQRRELRKILQESIDEPMADVYGPDPTVINR